MATPKPIELYFVAPIYTRGEHIVGKNALTEDGQVNMVRIPRGTVLTVHADAAKDILIARQAIDNKNAKPGERREAEEYVRERNAVENAEPKKKAA